jgi:hypothetical protein
MAFSLSFDLQIFDSQTRQSLRKHLAYSELIRIP